MGCNNVKSCEENILYDFWSGLSISSTDIKTIAEDILNVESVNSEAMKNRMIRKYFINEKNPFNEKVQRGIDSIFDKFTKPEIFYCSLLFLCKQDKDQLSEYLVKIFAHFESDSHKNLVFKEDTILKAFLSQVLHVYLHIITVHMVDYLAPEDNTEQVKFKENCAMIFQLKFRQRYVNCRLHTKQNKNYTNFKTFIDEFYHDFRHDTVREILSLDHKEDEEEQLLEHKKKLNSITENIKEKEQKLIKELKDEEEHLTMLEEDLYKKEKELEFKKITQGINDQDCLLNKE